MQLKMVCQIDEGGFADVWLAECILDKTKYVLKVLREWRNPDAKKTFEQEAKILRQHQGPGVVKFFGEARWGEAPALILEYLPEGNLENHINTNGAILPEQALDILACVCSSLVSLHRSGGFHRDIKPANLLVANNGKVKIADFGLGRDPKLTQQMTYSRCGTPGYVAPEVWEGAEFSQEADIYSLGATLFHMVTGVRPTQKMDLAEALKATSLSVELKRMILALTHKNPEHRPTLLEIIRAADQLFPVEQKRRIEQEAEAHERFQQEQRDKNAAILAGLALAFGITAGAVLVGVGLYHLAKSR